jgi:DNA-binding TFAR19-related protein (PDSD5 family)
LAQDNEQNQQLSEEQQRRQAMQKRLHEMQLEQQKRGIVRRFLTPEAYERLMNVRVSNYELYAQLLDLIIAMAQAKKLYGKLTGEQLRDILARLTQKPETKLEFKHK